MAERFLPHIPPVAGGSLTELVCNLPCGKRVRGALYVHRDAVAQCAPRLFEWVETLAELSGAGPDFNVVKFTLPSQKVSFLSYPNFNGDPHPVLKATKVIHLKTGKVTYQDFSRRDNAPILHRKETLVLPSHPHYTEWKALTEAEERHGLYEKPQRIGLRRNWQRLLVEKGLRIDGHRLIPLESDAYNDTHYVGIEPVGGVVVKRHKTALVRYALSKPIQCLLGHGLLSGECSLLDYGCGRGDDVRYLNAMGYRAMGWDPVYRPQGPKEPADVVNLGYVLNVIEEPAERVEVLREAFALARSLLVVSVLTAGSYSAASARPYKDGILTKRQTFQKYYRQQELENFIESVLGATAVPVALGIFYVFKNPRDLQNFLANRSRRGFEPSVLDWKGASKGQAVAGLSVPIRRRRKQWMYEENQELLQALWQKTLELGRPPLRSEFDRYNDVCNLLGSVKKALRFLVGIFGHEELNKAVENRRRDLIAYIALSNFRKPVPFTVLPEGLQADIRVFLGSYTKALALGRETLFAAGNAELIAQLCDDSPLGHKDDKALYVHSSLVEHLHPILRVYVGCAELLCGEVQDADIVKIHKHSGKLTLLFYDDFFGNPFPELQTRVKVNLRSRQVDIFDHRSQVRQELLYFKERYVAPDHPDREKWAAKSRALQAWGLDLQTGYGPSKQELLQMAVSHPELWELLPWKATDSPVLKLTQCKVSGFAGSRRNPS